MNIHVISIGAELLIGHTTNTNLAFIGQNLAAAGYTINRETCIPDQPQIIRETLRQELAAADLVITIGGLGPTKDDMTRQAAADALGLELHLDHEVLDRISEYLAKRGVRLDPEALRIQAMVPDGATPLVNDNGTAPGLWCPASEGRAVVMLPGPPRELNPMFAKQVMARIRRLADPDVYRRTLHVCGIPESIVAERSEKAVGDAAGIELAYCARPAMVDVRLTAAMGAREAVDAACERVRREFAAAVLDPETPDMVAAVGQLLKRAGWMMATAESCTGGGIAARITDMPGASDFFAGSLVCYTNRWKEQLLGVSRKTLEKHGAVSEETAREMLDGVMARTGAEAGIAVTGIAGPGGGTAEKPVGLVYIAAGVKECRQVVRYIFPGTRENVRERTIAAALNQLRLILQKETGERSH